MSRFRVWLRERRARHLPPLRVRAIAVVVLVTVAPFLFVAVSGVFESGLGALTLAELEEAAKFAEEGGHQQGEGTASGTPSRPHSTVHRGVSMAMHGPSESAILQLAPKADASGVMARAAQKVGSGSECVPAEEGRRFRCALWRPWGTRREATLYLERTSERTIRSLRDDRRALFRLTLFVLPGSLLLGIWLSRRMVRPLETLRREVLARADVARPKPDLPAGSRDEFADLAQAFNHFIGRLGTRIEANEAFLQDLAHELKSPVSAVRACAERLSEGEVDSERAARLGRVLSSSSRKLELLMNDFLELASAEAGMRGEERTVVDMAALAEALVNGQRERHPDVTYMLSAEADVRCPGVAPRLEAAVSNLLDNATSFAGESGQVQVDVRRSTRGVEVEVRDSGPGIAPDDLPHVFDRFFTRRAGRGGTGLGLALVHAVASAHGGEVSATSTPGQGACFVLALFSEPDPVQEGSPSSLAR